MNANKLKAIMALNGDTGAKLAEALGIARPTFSLKLHNKGTDFTRGEIQIIKDRYKLSAEEVDDIFFNIKVS